jgi:hypothetical protein
MPTNSVETMFYVFTVTNVETVLALEGIYGQLNAVQICSSGNCLRNDSECCVIINS